MIKITIIITIFASNPTHDFNIMFIISTYCSFVICHLKSLQNRMDSDWLSEFLSFIILHVIPTMLFLCAVIVIVELCNSFKFRFFLNLYRYRLLCEQAFK